MSRWFRMYDDVINDPKVMRLSEATRWRWVAVLCASSKNGGVCPAAPDLSFLLRMSEQQAASLIVELHRAGLLDQVDGVFVPHNWDGRQYESDSSAERMRRHRQKKKVVTCDVGDRHSDGNGDVTVTVQSRDRTETETDSKAIALAADALADPRTELFRSGLTDLAAMTGKGPNACRSFIGKCLQAAGDDAVIVLGLIEDAKLNRVADPSSWISARLKARAPAPRATTVFQKSQQESRDILNELQNYASTGIGGGESDTRLLLGHSGDEQKGIHRGAGSEPVDIPS